MTATDESGHSDVADMKTAALEAISLCEDTVLAMATSGQESATSWAGAL